MFNYDWPFRISGNPYRSSCFDPLFYLWLYSNQPPSFMNQTSSAIINASWTIGHPSEPPSTISSVSPSISGSPRRPRPRSLTSTPKASCIGTSRQQLAFFVGISPALQQPVILLGVDDVLDAFEDAALGRWLLLTWPDSCFNLWPPGHVRSLGKTCIPWWPLIAW